MEPPFIFDPDPPLAEIKALVREHHYSGCLPSSIVYVAGVRQGGALVAGIVYSTPPTRWSQPVVELGRLVRKPGTKPPLTMLISKSVKVLAKRKNADLVVSFADSTQGHHGGVYQAASWNFHETRKPSCDGFVIDGVFTPRRALNHRLGSSSVPRITAFYEVWGGDCRPHYDTGKHLYWRALAPSGLAKANLLGLHRRPYPKPFGDIA